MFLERKEIFYTLAGIDSFSSNSSIVSIYTGKFFSWGSCIQLTNTTINSGGSRGGRCNRPSPLKFDWLQSFLIPFCIRMLKHKDQIAKRASKTRKLPGPCTPAVGGLRSLRSWCACTHIIFCVPPPHENPGSNPALKPLLHSRMIHS